MTQKYDAIIVGAGIGGLTTAALLQHAGLRTLTIEQHYLPGGSSSFFKKRGYTFDAGASLFYGFGSYETGGTLNLHRRIFDRLGIEVKTIPDPVQIHYHLPNDFEIRTHYDKERFLTELIARFPREASGIRKFYQELEDVFNVIGSFPAGSLENLEHLMFIGVRHPLKVLKLMVQTMKNMGKTARKYIRNQELLKFIDIESYAWAVRDALATPLVNAGICLADRHHGGINYPVGGSGSIANALVKGIRHFGGEVLLGKRVAEIITRNGKAFGVKLSDGTEYFSRVVVSNATVWDTFNSLIKEKRFRVDNSKFDIAPSWLQLHLGVKKSLIPEKFNVHHIIVEDWETYDNIGGTIYFSAPTILDPTCAPDGKHVLHVFTTALASDWQKPVSKNDTDYLAAKEAQANQLIRRTERLLPGLSDAIDLKLIASPHTHERYLSRYLGSYGPLLRKGQYVLEKPQNFTPVRNLYHVGDSCFPGQGVIAVTYSGVSCANLICKKLGTRFQYL
ncbi:FAD dependent oxidoreductase [Chloroherpeton thalassium ATCC 35110]|uniref:FAD dependent oxidoreductase n=1 Tax=Chloroherpeton thalassium (strain ATCC 35110 / GB-78) TaxID=517418 RepID=B3QZ32_CHLT3|nr:NAD(P)/FAD-dependent oxidoreductase [Chloroherpeton thalassium]ACF13725.1 FAD dependent oxidoreductase [Chloroherpeton thalassium ATCC 35110]